MNSPNPPSVKRRLCKHLNVLYCFCKSILKIRANLKRDNLVYIFSSKHT